MFDPDRFSPEDLKVLGAFVVMLTRVELQELRRTDDPDDHLLADAIEARARAEYPQDFPAETKQATPSPNRETK
jgi:hypothetical protein